MCCWRLTESLVHSDHDAEVTARELILAHEKWLPNFAAFASEALEISTTDRVGYMKRVLIVNADDFGLSKGAKVHGVLTHIATALMTSTTALVNGEAIDHAAQQPRAAWQGGNAFCFDVRQTGVRDAADARRPVGSGSGKWRRRIRFRAG